MKPLISIIIPAYNAANYLAEAIDCALAQTYKSIEVIVVNDGSHDNGETDRIARSYENRIRYISKENGGSSSALNTGIRNMRGEWFSWLSHDDLYLPDKIEKQVAYMESQGFKSNALSRNVFFSATDLIDASGKIIRKCNLKSAHTMEERLKSFPHNGHLIAEPTAYYFYGCSCLIHRDAFEEIGLFDENLRLLNDVDFWFRLYSAGYHIHYIPEPLVKARIHAKQVSRSIGFSYHNPEQDAFWGKSFDWLMENYPEEDELFYRFGRNAYLKTRNIDGDRAFAHVISKKPERKFVLLVLKRVFCGYAFMRGLAKRIYMKLKM